MSARGAVSELGQCSLRRSAKGRLKRLNGTSRREFWERYAGDLHLPSLQAALRTSEHASTHLHPHPALGYQTPAQHFAGLGTPQL